MGCATCSRTVVKYMVQTIVLVTCPWYGCCIPCHLLHLRELNKASFFFFSRTRVSSFARSIRISSIWQLLKFLLYIGVIFGNLLDMLFEISHYLIELSSEISILQVHK